jgi:hypothetical protein
MRVVRTFAFLFILIAAAGSSSLVSAAPGGADDKQSMLTLIVLKDDNGKPIRNASVILHPVDKNGKQSRGGQQLKTNPEGKTSYPGVPYGKLRVQVIMSGYQTFGGDFDIDKPEQEITVKLKRPTEQYSIYK